LCLSDFYVAFWLLRLEGVQAKAVNCKRSAESFSKTIK